MRSGQRPELADVFRAHGERLGGLSGQQRRVVAAITSCRTAALGGHVRECDRGCGYAEISYNSCRDRHCPKCQGLERVRWQEARAEDLLPVPYFHLVFTVSDALDEIFLAHPRVLAYLGRYTHRIAISNERIVAMDGDDVTFSFKDRADGDRRKSMTLPAEAFLRRFLLHVLPGGFVRIRHYGLLANSVRRERIALCRKLLDVAADVAPPAPREGWEELLLRLTGKDVTRCPQCGIGRLRTTRRIEPATCLRLVEEKAASP